MVARHFPGEMRIVLADFPQTCIRSMFSSQGVVNTKLVVIPSSYSSLFWKKLSVSQTESYTPSRHWRWNQLTQSVTLV